MSALKNAGGLRFSTLLSTTRCALLLVEVAPGSVEARWHINHPSEYYQTIDVTLTQPTSEASDIQQKVALSDTIDDEPHRFLVNCIKLGVPEQRYIKLIIPTVEGFIGRRNFFERRLLDCPFTQEIVSFLVPERRAGPAQLEARLAFPWLLSAQASRQNVVLVEGYPHLQMGAGFIQAVKDLDVALLVLGPKGPKHWLEDPANAAGFCQALVPVDLTFDAGLPGRIADAVRGYIAFDKVDGIFTAHDRYLVATAQAAVILGLPSAPVRAHEISTDKYAMRQFQADSQSSDFQLFQFNGVDDAQRRLAAATDPVVVSYPAIVKPISGFASEGVAKVANQGELLESIGRVNTARHGAVVIVETYIDGPEFDANFVLRDGEILFFELTDDFPSEGDMTGAGASAPFFETSELTPSGLNHTEREIVRTSLHKTLLDLGFTWGLYHIEGRLKDSSKEYRADAGGIVDLHERLVPRRTNPSCFLLEINARVPGVGCSFSTIHTYGADFYAVPLLACTRDAERLKLIATPFAFPARPDGSQYWCQTVFIQPARGGATHRTTRAATSFADGLSLGPISPVGCRSTRRGPSSRTPPPGSASCSHTSLCTPGRAAVMSGNSLR
ncbi:ATP-grasp domain-containing protein [Mycena rosella]|uniref:ATP-grasp domain-containing protein n=1 Tax=Mycena rosella TaxID=1033263 RepID=A0AAD7DJ59_MYCRO|nr:ATP-grasp domain-containing protein [Mycena rosella]